MMNKMLGFDCCWTCAKLGTQGKDANRSEATNVPNRLRLHGARFIYLLPALTLGRSVESPCAQLVDLLLATKPNPRRKRRDQGLSSLSKTEYCSVGVHLWSADRVLVDGQKIGYRDNPCF
jgi:hypothetical protein